MSNLMGGKTGFQVVISAAAIIVASSLSGCSMGKVELSGAETSPQTVTLNIAGKVHGGQQAVVGSNVRLWAAGSTGYGSAPTALIASGGSLGSVLVTNVGTGYTSAPTVAFTGGGGTGAAATASVSTTVQTLTLNGGGAGYTSAPTVVFTGGSPTTPATATATFSNQVSSLSVTAAGSGFTSVPTVTILPSTTPAVGMNAAATPILAITGATIPVTTEGSNYTTAPTVTFTGGGGTGAAGTASITQGVTSVTITGGGTGYTSVPTVTFSGGGGTTQATGTAILSGGTTGSVTSITITNPGAGYTSTPSIAFSTSGASVAATATPNLSGVVNAISITSGGSGYTSFPTITLSGGGGSGAAATAVANISGLTLTSPGTGYTAAPTVAFVGGGGTGATATATITGYVSGITLTSGGTGYSSVPAVSFTGGGSPTTAATATATGVGLTGVTLTAAGSGYTSNPTVTFTGGGGSGAAAVATAVPSSGTITSDAFGGFNITGDYTCPAAPSNGTGNVYVYMTATGGNPGVASANTAIQMVAPLGTCASLSGTTTVFIDEVTTAAAAFALGQYASGDSIGAPNTLQAQTALANAFATVNNLVNIANGNAQTSIILGAVTATPESAKLYTIADVLAACVNSTGVSDPGLACSTLFSNVSGTGFGGLTPAPTDVFEAAVDMSLNPTSSSAPGNTSNINTIYNIISPTPPFPAGAAPADWTIGINYASPSALPQPLEVAADAAGNIWVLNNSGNIVELNPTGTPTTVLTSLAGTTLNGQGTHNISIDGTPLSSSYTPTIATASTTSTSNMYLYNASTYPNGAAFASSKSAYDVVFDASNNAWLGNESTSAHFSLDAFPAGTTFGTTNATTNINGILAFGFPNIPSSTGTTVQNGATAAFQPEFMAFDPSGNLWISSNGALSADYPFLVELTNITFPSTGSEPTGCLTGSTVTGPCFGPGSVTGTSPYTNTSLDYNQNFGSANYDGVNGQATTTANQYVYTVPSLEGTATSGPIYEPLNPIPAFTPAGAGSPTPGVWVANSYENGASPEVYNDTISYISSPTATTAVTIGSSATVTYPHFLAMDGAGNIWVANKTGSITSGSVGAGVSEFIGAAGPNQGVFISPTSASPTTTNPGFVHAGLQQGFGLTIDPSGNVWVANQSTSSYSVEEIVGAAVPVITPLALQLVNYKASTANGFPGKP